MSTPVPENRYRFPFGVDCAAMRGCVHAASHAAENNQPTIREVTRQALGHPQSIGRGMASAHDRDPRVGDRIDISAHIENQRRIVDLFQLCGIGAII
jgi:hypothetical protein